MSRKTGSTSSSRSAGAAAPPPPGDAAAAGPSTPAKARPDRTRTHRGLTCANCRARKTRCDGTQPTCKTCEVYQDECRYEKPPPMSQIIAMARRLQEAEQTVADLRRALDTKTQQHQALLQRAGSVSQQQQQFQQSQEQQPHHHSRHSSIAVSPKQEEVGSASGGSIGGTMPMMPLATNNTMMAQDGPQQHQHSQSPSPALDRPSDLMFDISMDSNGKLSYFGPTSAVRHPPLGQHQHHSQHSNRSPITMYDDAGGGADAAKSDVRSLLTSKALESRAWEDFALGNAAVQTDIPRAVVAQLLQLHWAWIAPTFMWVYRPAFMRDMATGGKYYSPLLLTVMCGHAARFQGETTTRLRQASGETAQAAATAAASADPGDALITRARLLLSSEIHRPSAIPTVQALLQLSARDLAYGRVSQAWLYSGMAFRMVSDLGLQHSSSGQLLSLGNLDAEDLEIRRRLYWSCYFWDKAISLYLGRMPTLVDLPFDSSPELLDDLAEHEPWTPFYGDAQNAQNLSRVAVGTYPAGPSYAISCFENSCRLAVILCDIILQLYSRRRAPDVDGTIVNGIRQRLDAWRARTPPHLRLEPGSLPDLCCPPHIMTQNLLYYTTVILLHRPFYCSPVHHAACREAADALERLLLLLERTFGFSRITYLIAYCAYTGASIMVQDVKKNRDAAAAHRKLQTFTRALQEGMTACPLAQRSLDIINECLQQKHQPSEVQQQEQQQQPQHVPAQQQTMVPPPAPTSMFMHTSRTSSHDDLRMSAGTPSGGTPTTTTTSTPPPPLTQVSAIPTTSADTAFFMRHYLPAFPYRDMAIEFNGAPGMAGAGLAVPAASQAESGQNMTAAMDLDTFSLLDSFPENHFDGATGAWYMPQ